VIPDIKIHKFSGLSAINLPNTIVTNINFPTSKRALDRFSFCFLVSFTDAKVTLLQKKEKKVIHPHTKLVIILSG